MTLLNTESLRPGSLPASANHQVYCGLDNCLTKEVFEAISAEHPEPPQIYRFEQALQGPYLEIMLRGFRIDQMSRLRAAEDLHKQIEFLQRRLNALAGAVWDRGLNARSPKELMDLFYGVMRLPEVYTYHKGVKRLSMNREALEKLEGYLYARPFVALVLAIRDTAKQLEVFETAIDPDGRYRTSYNIAGTETGRPSSSENAFGTGGNAQNIAPGLRHVFVADKGYKLAVIDAEQVEARDVGFFCGCLFGDWTYLDSCESGDLHTSNTRLVWPELGWTGDLKKDREIADRQFYRDFSYRDMAKRGSHLSNYSGTAFTASRALKVEQHVMEEFQARYCRGRQSRKDKWGNVLPAIEPAFPVIPRWWRWTQEQLQTAGWLETPFGFRRHFFGDPQAAETLREAIAFLPQSTTAQRSNLVLWRIWKHMPHVRVLAQTYDSVTFEYPESCGDQEIQEEVLSHTRVPLRSSEGRLYNVPWEFKCGWNWGYYDYKSPKKNPDGLRTLSAEGDMRQRSKGLEGLFK